MTTEPTTPPAGRDDDEDQAVALVRGAVVRFPYVDPIFGGQPAQLVGVVLDVNDETVAVAPVQSFALTVPVGDVEQLDG